MNRRPNSVAIVQSASRMVPVEDSAVTRGPDPLVERLNQSYYGHLRKALQTCIKGICLQYGELSRSSAAAQ